jgi:flagellar protein FlaG
MAVEVIVKGAVTQVRQASGQSGPVAAPATPAASRQELPAQAVSAPPPAAEVNQAIRNISDYVQSLKRDLHFSVDEDSGKTVVTVVDPATGDVIRQIPSEEVLAIARRLADASGVFLKVEA